MFSQTGSLTSSFGMRKKQIHTHRRHRNTQGSCIISSPPFRMAPFRPPFLQQFFHAETDTRAGALTIRTTAAGKERDLLQRPCFFAFLQLGQDAIPHSDRTALCFQIEEETQPAFPPLHFGVPYHLLRIFQMATPPLTGASWALGLFSCIL